MNVFKNIFEQLNKLNMGRISIYLSTLGLSIYLKVSYKTVGLKKRLDSPVN